MQILRPYAHLLLITQLHSKQYFEASCFDIFCFTANCANKKSSKSNISVLQYLLYAIRVELVYFGHQVNSDSGLIRFIV